MFKWFIKIVVGEFFRMSYSSTARFPFVLVLSSWYFRAYLSGRSLGSETKQSKTRESSPERITSGIASRMMRSRSDGKKLLTDEL